MRVAFLGCGFITGVHSRHLRSFGDRVQTSYASRDPGRAEALRRRFGGVRAYEGYGQALADPEVDAVVVAVPPALHLDLTLEALGRGKHVLVEKPAFPSLPDYRTVIEARDQGDRVVIVGENDHYKPLAVTLRRIIREGTIGELVLVRLTTVARRPKPPDDWRQDPALACGDAFFEEGIHWLHLVGSLGPGIRHIQGYRPAPAAEGCGTGEARRSSMLVAFQYDTGAAGAILYSREIPVLLRGLRLSKLYGRDGVVTFESNGLFVVVRGQGGPRVVVPGIRDLRGYRAMYADWLRAIDEGSQPEMSVERAEADHELMERVVASARAATVDGGRPPERAARLTTRLNAADFPPS